MRILGSYKRPGSKQVSEIEFAVHYKYKEIYRVVNEPNINRKCSGVSGCVGHQGQWMYTVGR